jgi:hypothetical protein
MPGAESPGRANMYEGISVSGEQSLAQQRETAEPARLSSWRACSGADEHEAHPE